MVEYIAFMWNVLKALGVTLGVIVLGNLTIMSVLGAIAGFIGWLRGE